MEKQPITVNGLNKIKLELQSLGVMGTLRLKTI